MPFKRILVALDGSKYSRIATSFAFWLATNLSAHINAQHVIDPRLADLLVSSEYTEELGLSESLAISEKVFVALRKIGNIILNVAGDEGSGLSIHVSKFLDEGHAVEEILKRAEDNDLVVVGHRGRSQQHTVSDLVTGSIAERVAVGSHKPVLIAATPIEALKEVLVAYDGSEPSQGALLMAEQLAKKTGLNLKAVTVIPDSTHKAEAELTIEQGSKLLRESWEKEVFSIQIGETAPTLVGRANRDLSLLVIGAYGFRNPESNVMGRTVTSIVRNSQCSLLIYR